MANNDESIPDTDSETHKCESGDSREPTNRDIINMLKTMNDNFSKKLDHLGETVETLKGEVFSLQQDNDKLKTELGERKKREESLQRKVKEAVFEAKLADERSDRNEQYSRRNNVKLLFVEEKSGGFESAEESEEKALRIFHDKLDLRHIKPENIEVAHRIGQKKDGQIRPIIVKFISRKTKKEIIQNRRKLKGSTPKIVIVEDLTKKIYTLYRQVADHPGTVQCWTTDGKIFAKDMDLKTFKIETLVDLQRLSIEVPTPSSSTAARRQQFQRTNRWADIFDPPPSSSTPRVTRARGTDGKAKVVDV